MTRIQLACYALTASAFILGGILVSQLASLTPTAEADLVLSSPRGEITLMTTRSANDEEALIVLDSANNRLIAFKSSLGRGGGSGAGRIEFVDQYNLARAFGGGGGGGGRGGR